MSKTKWKEYEIAVKKFITALDPNAKVEHDIYLPDKHTKKPRQRDVYIMAKVCNHFPVEIYVSCKRYKRKLNLQDIDAFYGELISSGANKGVIYSYSGYSKNAIEKCKVLNISCCRLYKNQPPDIPEILYIRDTYCCQSKLGLNVKGSIDPGWNFYLWKDLFEFSLSETGKKMIDILVEIFESNESKTVKERGKNEFPLSCTTRIELTNEKNDIKPVIITIQNVWKVYKGSIKAYLVNGSYSFSDNDFVGSQTLPIIDTKGSHPGPGWSIMQKNPSKIENNTAVFILYGGNARETLLNIAKKRINTIDE